MTQDVPIPLAALFVVIGALGLLSVRRRPKPQGTGVDADLRRLFRICGFAGFGGLLVLGLIALLRRFLF